MSLLGADGGNSGGAGGTSGGGSGGAGDGGAGGGTSGGAGTTTGSGAAASWRDTLPDDIKGNVTLGKFSDVNSLAKSYIDIQGLVGKKGVFPPGDKATPEQWKDFYKTIGQPEFEKFEIKAPEGKKLNQPMVDEFKKMAHESGMMPQNAQKLLDWYLGQEEASGVSAKAAKDQQIAAGLETVKKEWGDGFARKVHEATSFVKEIGGQEAVDYLANSGLGKDPTLLRLLAKAAPLLGEDKIRGEGGGKFGQTPEEIRAEIAKVEGDLKNPYYDKTHMGHAAAVKQMELLYQKLHAK